MKRNVKKIFLILFGFIAIQPIQAQKKGEKSVLFFKYTFDKFNADETEVSEPGKIDLLLNLKPSTSYPADVFYGTGDFGTGANMYGYALPIDPKNERFDGNDKNTFVTTDDLKDGNVGYAGIVTYKPGKQQKEKSYVTIPFLDAKNKPITMIKGKKYCVEMSISLAEASKYATNNIGMMFVKDVSQYQLDATEGEDSGPINVEQDRIMYNYKNKVYNSYSGWDKVCGTYVAKGDEKGVVIGNFIMNDKTIAEIQKKIASGKQERDVNGELSTVPAVLPMAYYFIDNVRIKEVDSKEPCNCIKADTSASAVEYSKVVITKEPVVSEKMTPEQKVAAQVIYYAFGKEKPAEVGKGCIDYVGEFLKANPTKKVTIHAHNDQLEDSLAEAYEDLREELENLDVKRGDYIKTRLMEVHGISEDRIVIIPENALVPNKAELTEDDDPNDRELILAYNRRVVFEIK